MAQDIRELLKQDKQIPSERIREGHQQRFMDRLEKELPKQKRGFDYSWIRIAASVVVILSVSFMAFNQFGNDKGTTEVVNSTESPVKNSTVVLTKQSSSVAEIYPDYEQVENTVFTTVKFYLSQIKIDDTNRELVESFMKRLENLDKEYQRLNEEFLKVGPNMQSIEAMKENLTMRLTLLTRLQEKLKELEKIENENYNEIQA
ncbi:hypothetical protein [Aquimarina sp. MMG016]|uniref:hypothetical protein n=1 Tax=Aquimarina sp. MMG016 TaxID=2822690 RepID=UPI001B3A473F|nr:hypothetical protein [Aquimarina sp. MMG016]MBQ4820339.1 hypothetical protein [Aquimarina sp. MMG016]